MKKILSFIILTSLFLSLGQGSVRGVALDTLILKSYTPSDLHIEYYGDTYDGPTFATVCFDDDTCTTWSPNWQAAFCGCAIAEVPNADRVTVIEFGQGAEYQVDSSATGWISTSKGFQLPQPISPTSTPKPTAKPTTRPITSPTQPPLPTATNTPGEPTQTPKPTKVVDPKNKPTLPKIFTIEGSRTTNIDLLKKAELKNVSELTFEIKDKGLILFTEKLDISNQSVLDKLKDLDKYLTISDGYVELSSFPELNSPARIILLNLNLRNNAVPIILKDSETIDNDSLKLVYTNNIVSFEVSSFSKYTIAPGLNIVSSEDGSISGYVDYLDSNVSVNGESVNIDDTGSFTYFTDKSGTYDIKAETYNGDVESINIYLEIGQNVQTDDDSNSNLQNLLIIALIIVTVVALTSTSLFLILLAKNKRNKVSSL